MNKASRFQRALMFTKECESALLNRLGPGPAEYETQFNERERFGIVEKNKFTIPRVSKDKFNYVSFYLIFTFYCID
jgi:hypothetical protein